MDNVQYSENSINVNLQPLLGYNIADENAFIDVLKARSTNQKNKAMLDNFGLSKADLNKIAPTLKQF
jgi:hypothetical protein